MYLLDSHIHLNSLLYENVPSLLAKARSRGIERWIMPGTKLAEIDAQVTLKATTQGVENAFGIHPWEVQSASKGWQTILETALQQHQAVAIGECGLDGAIDSDIAPWTLQLAVFEAQVELAQSLNRPLIIHSYKAVDQVLKILRRYPSVTGVWHSYNGSLQQLEQIIDLGYYIGMGGAVTFERAQRMRRNLQQIPLSRLLLETDGPYQVGAYGEKEAIHYPEDLYHIAQSIAEQRALSLADLAKITTKNGVQLFKLELE